jgi:hypothetical protein
VGFAMSWLAIRAPKAEAFEPLGLRPTGEQRELLGAPIAGTELPSGWTLVVANGCDHALISDARLVDACEHTDLVACSIEEHVMYSAASFWSRGKRVWSVVHDAQRAIDHLETFGELPPSFAEIRAALLAQQSEAGGADSDTDFIFDAPLVLAQRLTGFKHDDAGGPESFDTLQDLRSEERRLRRPWWKFW